MQRSQIFVQNRVFCLPHIHSTPPLGGFPSEYRHPVWHGKNYYGLAIRWWKNFEDIFIRFDATHERAGHTHTAWRHRPRLCIASRGKNCCTAQSMQTSADRQSRQRQVSRMTDEKVRLGLPSEYSGAYRFSDIRRRIMAMACPWNFG